MCIAKANKTPHFHGTPGWCIGSIMLTLSSSFVIATMLVFTILSGPQHHCGTEAVAVKLCRDLSSSQDVTAFIQSPDGALVIYRGDELNATLDELFSVGPSGSVASVRISRANVSYGANGNQESVQEFSVSLNSLRVVYRAWHESIGYHLYSTPTDGSGGGVVTRLDEANDVWASVTSDFFITPDGSTVVYRADQSSDGVFEHFAVPIDGPRTSGIVISPSGGFIPALADDGALLVFDQSDNLYSVPVAGGGAASPTLLSTNGPGEEVPANQWKVSPEGSGGAGSKVVYVGRNATTAAETLQFVDLPFSGGSPSPLSHDPLTSANGPNININEYQWSSDGSRIFFTSDPDTNGLFDLYTTLADGSSSPFALTDMASSASSTGVQAFQVAPNGARVAYVADSATSGVFELFTVPAPSGPPSSAIKVSGTMAASRDVVASSGAVQFTEDSSKVIYETDQGNPDGEIGFWVATADGSGAPVRLSPVPGFLSGPLDDIKVGVSNSRFAVYRGLQDDNGRHELYAVGLTTGESSSTKLNDPITWTGGIANPQDYAVTLDDTRVVYIADQVTNNIYEIFSVAIPASILTDGPGGTTSAPTSSGSGSSTGTASAGTRPRSFLATLYNLVRV